MKDRHPNVPGVESAAPETTSGVSHGTQEAGSVAWLAGKALPLTEVDRTKTEAVTTDAPGV